jgi:hypothetical protein
MTTPVAYDPANIGGIPTIDRIKPFTAVWVGDSGGPLATSNMQQYANLRRPFKGTVAGIAARDALIGLTDGDFVMVKANATGHPEIFLWHGAPTSAWETVSAAAAAVTDAATLQGHAAAYFATAAQLASVGPFFRCQVEGDLSAIPAGSLPVQLNAFLNSGAARTLSKIVIYCPRSGTGSVALDITKQAVAGVAGTLYVTNPASKPVLVGNGGLAALVITGANLPSTVSLADLEALIPTITAAPNNPWLDLVIEFYP